MPQFQDLPDDWSCPHRHGCPYLEGLSTSWVFHRYQEVAGTECHYEYQLEQIHHQLDAERQQRKRLELENQQLRAQLQALHRRQFKGRKAPPTPTPDCPSAQPKKRGAPVGHPPWQRAKPKQLDRIVPVPAPQTCPHCHGHDLQPVQEVQHHVQEDIVLEPRTVATCFVHQQAYCPVCDRHVGQPGPGELLGAYIGPAAKATALYLRYELNASNRRISRFFAEFFGLKFVPASAFGFERQAVRRGRPLYADLLDKVRSLAVAHADETSWRNDGDNFYVWFGGDDDLAAFMFQKHRSIEAAQELLGEHFGGVVADEHEIVEVWEVLEAKAQFALAVGLHEVSVVNDGDEHFGGAVEAEGFLNQEAFAVVVATLELDLKGFAEDAQGVVIGVEGAVDHRGHHPLGVVVDQGLLEDGFAGAGLAQDQAKAALLGVNAENVEDLLLVFEQAEVFGVEGIALEAKVRTDHRECGVESSACGVICAAVTGEDGGCLGHLAAAPAAPPGSAPGPPGGWRSGWAAPLAGRSLATGSSSLAGPMRSPL